MNRVLIIAAVGLAAYALLDIALSAFVAIAWRTRAVAPSDLPPVVRARRLLYLRLVPAAGALLGTLAVALPAFAIHEPAGHGESIGPALFALALAALAQAGVSAFLAVRSAVLTARIQRAWLRSSSALDAQIAGGLPAFAIDSPLPIVALVGVFSPKLIAARSLVAACSADELASIVGHERGHLQAGDNLKRWVMASLPDALRWTVVHREMMAAWHHAAEDAADDESTGRDARARAELAALLLKVVRFSPGPMSDAAIVSPFVENDGLERRVRRLLRAELEPPAPVAIVPMLAVAVTILAAAAAIASPGARGAIFQAFESLVALWR